MNKTVLIIEDEIVLQDVYKMILISQGYDVYTANNGIEGINKLKAVKPRLVLVDLFMPVMDGKEFLRNIDMADFPETRFVVCTNMSDKEVENEMRALGAHMFVLKSSMAPQDLVKLARDIFKTQ